MLRPDSRGWSRSSAANSSAVAARRSSAWLLTRIQPSPEARQSTPVLVLHTPEVDMATPASLMPLPGHSTLPATVTSTVRRPSG